jgi:hypothetical protein
LFPSQLVSFGDGVRKTFGLVVLGLHKDRVADHRAFSFLLDVSLHISSSKLLTEPFEHLRTKRDALIRVALLNHVGHGVVADLCMQVRIQAHVLYAIQCILHIVAAELGQGLSVWEQGVGELENYYFPALS